MKTKAVFLDRDGVINELVYYPDPGIVDSPFTAAQFRLAPGVGPALRGLKQSGYMLVVASNQPGIARKRFTMKSFRETQAKMRRLLAKEGVTLDAEYYCFHHPQGRIPRYSLECDCRKPKPGMLIQAASELGIELANSVMIGDGLYDIEAGRGAGCKTILLANPNGLLIDKMEELGATPDYLARNIKEASDIVKKKLSEDGPR